MKRKGQKIDENFKPSSTTFENTNFTSQEVPKNIKNIYAHWTDLLISSALYLKINQKEISLLP